jgi:hypothetical protein
LYIKLLNYITFDWLIYLLLIRYENGTISLEVKNAVNNINGHSSATTRDYYLKKTQFQSVKVSQEAFDFTPRPTLSSNPNDKSLHPYGQSDEIERVPWTEYEKEYGRTWLANDTTKRRKLPRLLAAIFADPEARVRFHPNHLKSPAHLRAGYRVQNK